MLGHKETKDDYIGIDIVMLILCAFSCILFGLKVGGIVTWNWWWVIMPILIPFGIVIGFTLLIGVILVICGIMDVICGN